MASDSAFKIPILCFKTEESTSVREVREELISLLNFGWGFVLFRFLFYLFFLFLLFLFFRILVLRRRFPSFQLGLQLFQLLFQGFYSIFEIFLCCSR